MIDTHKGYIASITKPKKSAKLHILLLIHRSRPTAKFFILLSGTGGRGRLPMLWPFTSKRDAKLLPRPTSQLISFSHVVDDELLTLLYIDTRLSVWFAQAPRN